MNSRFIYDIFSLLCVVRGKINNGRFMKEVLIPSAKICAISVVCFMVIMSILSLIGPALGLFEIIILPLICGLIAFLWVVVVCWFLTR